MRLMNPWICSRKEKILFAFFVLFGALCVTAFASAAAQEQAAYCPALQNPDSYAEKESFNMLVPGKEGWIFRTKTDFKIAFPHGKHLIQNFKNLNEAFEQKNINLVISLLPTRGMMHADKIEGFDPQEAITSYTALVESLRAGGLHVAAVENFIPDTESFFYKRDHHWTAAGARRMAARVAEQIKTLPVYEDLPKRRFHTEETGGEAHPGTFAKFIADICGTPVQTETARIFRTYAEDADALLDDPVPAQIILLGTSNSTGKASRANFEGFLKQELQTDIDNRSVSGGGADTAMLEWLASEDWIKQPPKIIIWEFPVYQNYKKEEFFRQAISDVQGR